MLTQSLHVPRPLPGDTSPMSGRVCRGISAAVLLFISSELTDRLLISDFSLPMSSVHFEMTVSVLPGDIDEQNHVNNTVYLRWVQEVATAHWRALASRDAQASIRWVVVRHEIDYKAPAGLRDDVVLRTWVGKATRLTFERFTEIRRSGDGQLFSKARTLWCPINAQTGRPMRVPAEVRVQFST